MTTLPAGWKLVPVEPTDEMETAAEDDYEQRGETFPDWKAKYRAMLAAAPTPPASAQDDAKDVPVDVMAALDRMCTPLHTSVLSGATADADAFSMQLIRDYILRRPAPAAGDAHELKRKTDLIAELSKIIHNMTVAQQAAWIEWQHGAGAQAGMQWIENGLAGPGQIPEEDEPYGTEAQAYFDANQADPLPACHCGRPSNILHMGNGYCSQEHYAAAIAAQQGKGGQ